MSSLLPVLIVTVLILLNALFVAAEFGIVGISRMEVDRALRENRRGAKLLQWFTEDPIRQDRFIATAQLGITAASLGLGMYGEHELAIWIAGKLEGWGAERWIAAHSVASVVAISILTYFHIVVGEMVPKAIALGAPARTSLGVVYFMRALQLVFYPIVLALNGLGNLVLRVFGIRRSESEGQHYRSPEELAYIVRESEAGGLLRKKSARVLTELLDFGNLTAEEVMVPRVRVAGLPADMSLDQIRATLADAPHTRYPVYEGTLDRIVGMLHVHDVLRCVQESRAPRSDELRTVPHLPSTSTTDELLAAMRQTAVQMVVVMDEHGGTAGIVTVEDLFEEVVGDITERKTEEPQIVRQDDETIRVDGAVRIEDVGDALGVVLEHDEADTVSGLVLSLLGRPARVGDVVEYDGVSFEVLDVRGNGVGHCKASLMNASEPG